MERRDLLAGLAGVGTLAGGIAVTRSDAGGLLSGTATDGDGSSPTAPVTRIETFDAPGSEAGHRDVPERGSVTVLEFFATTCNVCADYMETLRSVRPNVDASFVSITVEMVGTTVDRETVVDWWRAHGGNWTVGVDDELVLSTVLNVESVPFTAVIDASNEVVYAESGAMSERELRDMVDRA
ncbi:TlpA disulfide reductase family protein [Halorubrum gandharaense]